MFAYNLGDRVKLKESDETGEVIGRADYSHAEPSFFIRYKCGDGRMIESWWTESAIEKAA